MGGLQRHAAELNHLPAHSTGTIGVVWCDCASPTHCVAAYTLQALAYCTPPPTPLQPAGTIHNRGGSLSSLLSSIILHGQHCGPDNFCDMPWSCMASLHWLVESMCGCGSGNWWLTNIHNPHPPCSATTFSSALWGQIRPIITLKCVLAPIKTFAAANQTVFCQNSSSSFCFCISSSSLPHGKRQSHHAIAAVTPQGGGSISAAHERRGANGLVPCRQHLCKSNAVFPLWQFVSP